MIGCGVIREIMEEDGIIVGDMVIGTVIIGTTLTGGTIFMGGVMDLDRDMVHGINMVEELIWMVDVEIR